MSPAAPPAYLVREDQLEKLAKAAAREGARRALAEIGLEDARAADDVRDLRDLLAAWHDARKIAWRTTIKVVTTGILAILLAGAAASLAFRTKLGL